MIMAEEAFDAILCRDRTSNINYSLQNVTLIDIDNDVVEMMRDSLLMVVYSRNCDSHLPAVRSPNGPFLISKWSLLHYIRESWPGGSL